MTQTQNEGMSWKHHGFLSPLEPYILFITVSLAYVWEIVERSGKFIIIIIIPIQGFGAARPS
jgi:hypothetical protein